MLKIRDCYIIKSEGISSEKFLIMFECLHGSTMWKNLAVSQQSKVWCELRLQGVSQERCSVCRTAMETVPGLRVTARMKDGKRNGEAL